MDNQQDGSVRGDASATPAEVEGTRTDGAEVLPSETAGHSGVRPVQRPRVATSVPVLGRGSSGHVLPLEQQNRREAAEALVKATKVSGVITTASALPEGTWMAQDVNDYGLGNRLRGWAGIGAAADVLGHNFAVRWTPNEAYDGKFQDIFEVDTCCIIEDPVIWDNLTVVRSLAGKNATRMGGWYRQKLMTSKQHDAFYKAMRARMVSLKLKPVMQKEVDDFMASIPAGVVGVHVRRTDFQHATKDSDNRLLNRLDKYLGRHPDAQFLVCADNAKSLELLLKEYPDRIHWRTQDMGSLGEKLRHTSPADAAMDMFCLAKTSMIFGTARSSFSLFAAQMAGIQLQQI